MHEIIQELRELQKELAVLQARLSAFLEKLELTQLPLFEVNAYPAVDVLPDGVKITIPNEYPPKTAIYDRIALKDGKITTYAYAEARNRWFGLIRKAAEGYKGPRIAPSIVYITYFVPVLCDVTNFTAKFIVDGLMYHGFTAQDDNLEKVNAVVQEAVLDKNSPRTEIYILRNTGQLKNLLPETGHGKR